MDAKKKSIQELQDNVADLYEKLDTLYTDVGLKLMDSPDESVPDDVIKQFKVLSARIAEQSETISKIQHGIDRLQEITRFTREIDHHTTELLTEFATMTENLGQQIFEHYTDAFASSFGTAYDIVRDEGGIMLDKQGRLSDLKKQYTTMGVLGKLQIKTKMLALEASVSQHRSKTAKAFREGAQAVLDAGIFATLTSIPAGLDTAYQACSAVTDKIAENKKRTAALADEAAAVRVMFMSFQANDNPRRRIEALKDELRALDVRSRFLAADTGKNFVGMYVSESGALKEECAAAIDSSSFKAMLEYAASLKKLLFTGKNKIQSVSAEIQIATLTRLVEKKNEDIDICKKKIKDLELLVAEYTVAVKDAEEQINVITDKKEEVDRLI